MGFWMNKRASAEGKLVVLKKLKQKRDLHLPQLSGAPLTTISALTGRGLERLREAILEMETIWNTRFPTAKLNRWLEAKVQAHPPPAPSGRRIRLRFMTQIKARPPSFMVSCSRPEDLPESYTRFLVNGLRSDLGMQGVPIRLVMRKGENPYADKKKPRGRKNYQG